jgi:hypothetical protein
MALLMLAHATALTAFFALMRGDRSQTGTSVSELARIVRDHELPLFRAIREFLVGWADGITFSRCITSPSSTRSATFANSRSCRTLSK